MGNRIVNLAGLSLLLIGLADLVIPSHVAGTQALLGGLTGLWRTTVNGTLGSTS